MISIFIFQILVMSVVNHNATLRPFAMGCISQSYFMSSVALLRQDTWLPYIAIISLLCFIPTLYGFYLTIKEQSQAKRIKVNNT
jgi:hypothetical protein